MALTIFSSRLHMRGQDIKEQKGPLMLAVNHSGSFFDAVILGALWNRDIHFLARGDAFKKPLANKILTALHNIPIYRLSEGKENLEKNDETFERCQAVFRKNGVVLIFSEGLCINEWKLRPLKKGTARMAISNWEDPTTPNLQVLPIGVNYSSFRDFGTAVYINVDAPLGPGEGTATEGVYHPAQLTKALTQSMQEQIFHFPNEDKTYAAAYAAMLYNAPTARKEVIHEMGKRLQQVPKEKLSFFDTPGHKALAWNGGQLALSLIGVLILLIPALAGFLLNAPLYFAIRNFANKKTRKTVFYHSVFFGLLMFIYPVYALLLSGIACIFLGVWGLAGLLALPVMGWMVRVFRDCWWRTVNYGKLKKEDRDALRGLFR